MSFRDQKITPPDGLVTDRFLLRPITVVDAPLDYEAVMESRESLRKWNQSAWPEDNFTLEANTEDVAKMAERRVLGDAFDYTVMNLDETECMGCVYIFSPSAKWFSGGDITELGDDQWSACDAMVFFWVRKSRVEQRLDRAVLDALCKWLKDDWSFAAPVIITNEQFDQQVTMIEESDLQRRFEIILPTDPGTYLAYR